MDSTGRSCSHCHGCINAVSAGHPLLHRGYHLGVYIYLRDRIRTCWHSFCSASKRHQHHSLCHLKPVLPILQFPYYYWQQLYCGRSHRCFTRLLSPQQNSSGIKISVAWSNLLILELLCDLIAHISSYLCGCRAWRHHCRRNICLFPWHLYFP